MAKGIFTPKHPEKYLGDPRKIRFLSSWELRYMSFCDLNPNVIQWGSEEIKIKYFKPTTGKVHDYIPDFFIKYKNKHGKVVHEIVEIKPLKETILTKKSTTYDKVNIAINRAKWTAAKAFCDKHRLTFRVITEAQLFRK